MINTNKGVTPMPEIDHLECEYSPFTKHWNCCTCYLTIDEADCDCIDHHDD